MFSTFTRLWSSGPAVNFFSELYTLPSDAVMYRGADKSLARPGRKQTTATEDFRTHILFIIIIGGILVLYIYIYMYK